MDIGERKKSRDELHSHEGGNTERLIIPVQFRPPAMARFSLWIALTLFVISVNCNDSKPPSCGGPGVPLEDRAPLVSAVHPPLAPSQRLGLLKYVLENIPEHEEALTTMWYALMDIRPGQLHEQLREQREAGLPPFPFLSLILSPGRALPLLSLSSETVFFKPFLPPLIPP